jgi:microcystin-dependent protein
MAQPFVGEIRLFGGNFAPSGWMFCNGQLLPISENETLFNLIGTTYGGDGQSTFALPDLRSRIPLHMGAGFTLAETGGVEAVTLTQVQMPSHNHPALANGGGNIVSPGLAYWSTDAAGNTAAYVTSSTGSNGNMAADAISPTGGSQPHTNIQPYTCVSYIISLFGIFPSQT